MKYCKDCRHLWSGWECRSPENGIDKVSGEPFVIHAHAQRVNNTCGPEARYFEPAKTLTNLLNTLFRKAQ